jgi:hypothetical protein
LASRLARFVDRRSNHAAVKRGGKTDDLRPRTRDGTATAICRKLRKLAFGLEQSCR